MEKKVLLSNEGLLQFSSALELLNASIHELNKVADNMVPEKLLHDGFLSYMQEFCQSLGENSDVKFVINTNIAKLGAGENTEIILFRAIRSLLLVLIRNSQPLIIISDFVISGRFLKIRIEDDGANIFRQPLLMVSQTIQNIAALLETLGGKLVTNPMSIAGNTIEIEVQL